MSKRRLMKGNEALCYAAIEAGCKFYAGYPITPQNEIPEKCQGWCPQKEFLSNYGSLQPPVHKIDKTLDNRVYNKISNIAREKFDLYQLGR